MSARVLGVVLAGLEPEEMLTAAIASARGVPTLAVGNVIGTNATIVTVALGLSAFIFPMVIDRSVRRQALTGTLVSVLPVVLLFQGIITQLEGVLLLVVFAGYTIFLFRVDREAIKRMAEVDDDDQEQPARLRFRGQLAVLTFGGVAAMAAGGPAIVEGAIRLAQHVGLSQGAEGRTIASLGAGPEM